MRPWDGSAREYVKSTTGSMPKLAYQSPFRRPERTILLLCRVAKTTSMSFMLESNDPLREPDSSPPLVFGRPLLRVA